MIKSLKFIAPDQLNPASLTELPSSSKCSNVTKNNPESFLNSHLPRFNLMKRNLELDGSTKNPKFDEKIQYFVELGLRPNCKMTYENLMKFNKAKKKLITFSDFMRKSLQKKLLSSQILSGLGECALGRSDGGKKVIENCEISSSVKPRIKKACSLSLLPVNERAREVIKGNPKRELRLMKLREIEIACDSMIKRKSYTKKPIKLA